MATFQHDGIDFNYIDEGRGTPFIFLHGLGGDLTQPLGTYKPPANVRLISMDFRGHGETRVFGSVEDISFSKFATDVLALARHLELDKFVIGGISMGAGVALNFTLAYPERVNGLVLSRVAFKDEPTAKEIQEAYQTIAELIQSHGTTLAEEKFKQTGIYHLINSNSPEAANSFLKMFKSPHIGETTEKLIRIPSDAPSRDRKDWVKITVPALVLATRRDSIHPYEYGQLMAESIPNCTFQELPPKGENTARHNELTQQSIDQFLSANYKIDSCTLAGEDSSRCKCSSCIHRKI